MLRAGRSSRSRRTFGQGYVIGLASDERSLRRRVTPNGNFGMRYMQIFRYVLTLNEAEYQQRWVDPYADGIAQAPGLISKTWAADFATGTFASIYVWQDKASMDAFMASPAIAQVAAEPFLKDLEITAIPVHETASAITRG